MPGEVGVLGRRARTFSADGHHYALVVVEGLEPGSTTEYEVELDGARVWPPRQTSFPPSRIRTPGRPGAFRIAFRIASLMLRDAFLPLLFDHSRAPNFRAVEHPGVPRWGGRGKLADQAAAARAVFNAAVHHSRSSIIVLAAPSSSASPASTSQPWKCAQRVATGMWTDERTGQFEARSPFPAAAGRCARPWRCHS